MSNNRPHRLVIRIVFRGEGRSLGPGKIAVLEAIGREGSISAAAKMLGMSYRRAWLHVDALNTMFDEPCVTTRPGRHGGGAVLTSLGTGIVASFRAIEVSATNAADTHLSGLVQRLAADPGTQR